STAVRITHLPTGFVVSCQNERALRRNRESAMRVLEARLLMLEEQKREEERLAIRGEHIEAGWGNQIRSYVLQPYRMVKDLRTLHATSDADRVLDGEIDEFLRASLQHQIGQQSQPEEALA
ncbi:MAG: peptide chain release factor 2, partial [Chloroflexi bacterium]|nr:peptide chain release factor 2 [Chloroflexota bacterium]